MSSGYYTSRMVVMLVNILVLAMFVAALALISPKSKTDKPADPSGELVVHITWIQDYKSGHNDDIDVWVLPPGDPAVGYSVMHGRACDLQFDDRGSTPDKAPIHYENIFCRKLVPGEYAVNVHCFRCERPPIEVRVQVGLKDMAYGTFAQRFTETVTMRENLQETTVVRFTLDKNRQIVPLSVNKTFIHLEHGS